MSRRPNSSAHVPSRNVHVPRGLTSSGAGWRPPTPPRGPRRPALPAPRRLRRRRPSTADQRGVDGCGALVGLGPPGARIGVDPLSLHRPGTVIFVAVGRRVSLAYVVRHRSWSAGGPPSSAGVTWAVSTPAPGPAPPTGRWPARACRARPSGRAGSIRPRSSVRSSIPGCDPPAAPSGRRRAAPAPPRAARSRWRRRSPDRAAGRTRGRSRAAPRSPGPVPRSTRRRGPRPTPRRGRPSRDGPCDPGRSAGDRGRPARGRTSPTWRGGGGRGCSWPRDRRAPAGRLGHLAQPGRHPDRSAGRVDAPVHGHGGGPGWPSTSSR